MTESTISDYEKPAEHRLHRMPHEGDPIIRQCLDACQRKGVQAPTQERLAVLTGLSLDLIESRWKGFMAAFEAA